MKKVLGCLSMAALAVVLAAPLPAQTIALRANVPFDFMVAGRTLPAGEYEFGLISQGGVLRVMHESGSNAVMTVSSADGNVGKIHAAVVEFHRYGNEYFLYKIWDGSSNSGRLIPTSRTEKELATRASASRPDVVMVLARL